MKTKNSIDLKTEVKNYLIDNFKGNGNAISMEQLAFEFNTSTRVIRMVIVELRTNNEFGKYFLVSDHVKGYWLTKKKNEIDEWLKGYLNKAASIFRTAKSAIKLSNHKKQTEILNLFSLEDDTIKEEIM